MASVFCPGTSKPFLVAVRMEGKLLVLREVTGARFNSEIQFDVGAWDSPDTLWHPVEIVVDPLNLFKETNEDNNRSVSQVRVVPPQVSMLDFLTRVIDTSGNRVTTAAVGQPLRVIASARVDGAYQSIVLSAKCAAFDFATSVPTATCADLVNGPPLVAWDWTPTTPGDYSIAFRLTIPGSEPDRDSTDNVITQAFQVTP